MKIQFASHGRFIDRSEAAALVINDEKMAEAEAASKTTLEIEAKAASDAQAEAAANAMAAEMEAQAAVKAKVEIELCGNKGKVGSSCRRKGNTVKHEQTIISYHQVF